MKNKIKAIEERKNHLLRLEKLSYEKKLYVIYEPSQIELNILRWFNIHSSSKIAKRLKVNRSYVYAVIEKYKKIYSLEELNNKMKVEK